MPDWQIDPQSVVVVPTPIMPLAPNAWTESMSVPPPAEQDDGAAAKVPVSPIVWKGMFATDSPAIEKSVWRTEPKA